MKTIGACANSTEKGVKTDVRLKKNLRKTQRES